jgi:hypothetical protein
MTTDKDDHGGPRPLSFSQRYGYTALPEAIQHQSLDERTRTDLYNAIYNSKLVEGVEPFTREAIYTDHFGRRSDHFNLDNVRSAVRNAVLKGEWYEVYDLIEFIARASGGDPSVTRPLNEVLARNWAGYRIVGAEVAPITDTTELETIRGVLGLPTTSPARQHIEKALQLFADRSAPQYANSIKESISAAEAAARDFAGKPSATLGAALDEVAKQQALHRALIDGWKKLYGFASDSGGIRHADAEGSVQPTQALALYFLVTCSAFVNLLIALQSPE